MSPARGKTLQPLSLPLAQGSAKRALLTKLFPPPRSHNPTATSTLPYIAGKEGRGRDVFYVQCRRGSDVIGGGSFFEKERYFLGEDLGKKPKEGFFGRVPFRPLPPRALSRGGKEGFKREGGGRGRSCYCWPRLRSFAQARSSSSFPPLLPLFHAAFASSPHLWGYGRRTGREEGRMPLA